VNYAKTLFSETFSNFKYRRIFMKTLLSTAFAAAFVFSSSLLADESKPGELSAAQMDQVTAGVGVGQFPGAGIKGWGLADPPPNRPAEVDPDIGLVNAGFMPGTAHTFTPGATSLDVTIPAIPPGHL
jgi:hypothetical protein